jgi:hypothetical protein
MGGTVHFDGKAGRTTEEIKGVGTERALSSELEAAGTVAKDVPEATLGRSHGAT